MTLEEKIFPGAIYTVHTGNADVMVGHIGTLEVIRNLRMLGFVTSVIERIITVETQEGVKTLDMITGIVKNHESNI
ncbi:hypothetical protein LCGC14_0245560 [marine sediment metagenome]|uniref:Uncharacterized protein n=1 Tax=marine sediment metagenome TaxID=412755 RepID=A0A0F9U634_9ZZZZ